MKDENERVNNYLDRLMTSEEIREFERDLQSDPQLQTRTEQFSELRQLERAIAHEEFALPEDLSDEIMWQLNASNQRPFFEILSELFTFRVTIPFYALASGVFVLLMLPSLFQYARHTSAAIPNFIFFGQGSAAASKPLLIANRRIYPGERITKDAVQLWKWPTETLPAGAITSADLDALVGTFATQQFEANMPILEEQLSPVPIGDMVSKPDQYRVITVPVSQTTQDNILTTPTNKFAVQMASDHQTDDAIVTRNARLLWLNVNASDREQKRDRSKMYVTMMLPKREADAVEFAGLYGPLKLIKSEDRAQLIEEAAPAERAQPR